MATYAIAISADGESACVPSWELGETGLAPPFSYIAEWRAERRIVALGEELQAPAPLLPIELRTEQKRRVVAERG